MAARRGLSIAGTGLAAWESARAVCAHARGTPADLKVYPAFTPTKVQPMAAPGHALFSYEGVPIWREDALALLARALQSRLESKS